MFYVPTLNSTFSSLYRYLKIFQVNKVIYHIHLVQVSTRKNRHYVKVSPHNLRKKKKKLCIRLSTSVFRNIYDRCVCFCIFKFGMPSFIVIECINILILLPESRPFTDKFLQIHKINCRLALIYAMTLQRQTGNHLPLMWI